MPATTASLTAIMALADGLSRSVMGTGGATCNFMWKRLEKNKQYAAPELQVFGRKFGLPLSGSKFHLPMARKD